MPDSFGAQTYPLSAPTEGDCAGDKGLGVLGSFLKVAVNAACDGMWGARGVCPGRNTVAFVFYHDPQKLFDEGRLPALYIWRSKSVRERVADELVKKSSTVEVAWITEPAEDDHLERRDPMMNAVADVMHKAIYRERDPAWIVAGDTDVLAARKGSSLLEYTGFSSAAMHDDSPEVFTFTRIDGGSAPLPYFGFKAGIDITEYLDEDNTAYPARLNASLSTNAAPSAATNVAIHTDVP